MCDNYVNEVPFCILMYCAEFVHALNVMVNCDPPPRNQA